MRFIPTRWFHRFPLACAAILFAAGIATGRHLSGIEFSRWFPMAAIVVLLWAIAFKKRPAFIFSCLFPLFFLAGLIQIAKIGPPSAPSHIYNQIQIRTEASIIGKVTKAPSFDGNKGRTLINVEQIILADGSQHQTSGLIRLSMPFDPREMSIPGDRLMARASLSRVAPPGTPGGFDFRQYLADRNIWITGWVRTSNDLVRVDVTSTSFWDKIRILPEFGRRKINVFLAGSSLTAAETGIYQAILTGEKQSIPLPIFKTYQNAGIVHLLAISGTHMGLLALICGLFVINLAKLFPSLLLRWPARKIAASSSLIILTAYLLIAGLNPPATRAYLMAATMIIALLMDRLNMAINALALAALLILIGDPGSLFTASFQLSFFAVLAILMLGEPLRKFNSNPTFSATPTRRALTWVCNSLAISCAAWVGTAPLVLKHFHQISLSGPPATLLAAPLICFWALPMGLFSCLLMGPFPGAAETLLQVGSLGITGATHLAHFFADLPGSALIIPPPTIPQIIGFYLIIATLTFWKKLPQRGAFMAVAMIFLLASPAFGILKTLRDEQATTVSFIDVGQGSSTLIEFPDHRAILIDGGGSGSDRFNPGREVIGPFLWTRGISHLDGLVITHAHADHINGLNFIIDQFHPANIWTNATQTEVSALTTLLEKARGLGIHIESPPAGTTLVNTTGNRLEVLLGPVNASDEQPTENDRSLVIRLTTVKGSILFPGDIMVRVGEHLLRTYPDLQCEVLLAPHHGGRTSASNLLMEKISPQTVVVSAGTFSKDVFPDQELLNQGLSRNIRMFNTAIDGTVACRITSSGLEWTRLGRKGAMGNNPGS
ncbi:MAG: DNA internalization-related competence protein ComEC/Rec2 [Proteobacteria bacterium]|nr:DNA internalization-related competence protein ComEC/Rec2 [Pseudomonadota bacterium]MBU1688623.1 DNA internalization-related competence protein ComEC/Rec2 [Pseudomonadota bacterium]